MAAKQIAFSTKARAEIARGLDALADVVKVTLGPRGRHVLIEKSWGPPTVTKDGATVAKEVELEGRFANLGAQMVKEVASRTAEVAGDGTTTATVLAQAIYRQGARLVVAGCNPVELRQGLEAAVAAAVAHLRGQSRPVRDSAEIAQLGALAANGDTVVGALIAGAMERVGKDGVITVEESRGMETSVDVVEGMQLDRGFLSPYFVTDAERMESSFQDAYVLIVERRISSMHELLPVLEQVAKDNRPLLVIAEDVDGEALATLVVNKLRAMLNVCAVKAPGSGERRRQLLGDIAALTGAQLVTADLGIELKSLTLKDLGRVKRAVVDARSTTLIEGLGDRAAIDARVAQLRAQLADATSERDREPLQERLAKLAGGVAVLRVGAVTEVELKERKARVEDALRATRAAVEEGVVPGGGVALVRAIAGLAGLRFPDDRARGVAILRRALEEPLRQIVSNAGLEGAVVVERVLAGEGGFGFNAATLAYSDLAADGVLDPTKVVRCALEHAASVAGLMLATEALVTERSAS